MAEQFTEAGQIGKDIRSKLGSAVKAAGSGAKWGYNYINDFVTEYGQEPLLNLYPQAVNLFAASGEVAAGMADKPVNLGRFPYYNLKTQFDKREEQKQVAAPIETQQEVPTITVTKKAARPEKLWRVMLQGGKSSEDEFYDTKEAADAALKKMGGKGAVAGIRFPAKSREEESALKEQYMQQARIGEKTAMLPKSNETEKESIMRQVREANPQATTAQQENYYKTLTASRARGRERGGYAEEYQAAVAKGKTPSPYEERLMEEEARNRRMSDFLTKSAAKGLAKRAEKSYSDEYKYLKSFERAAKKAGAFGSALEARKRLEGLSSQFGSGASSSSNRMKYFERQAMDEVKRQIDARDRMRRQLLQKQTISNPEASSSLAYTVNI